MQQNHKTPDESMPVTTKSMAVRFSSQGVPAIFCNAIHSQLTLEQVQFLILPVYSTYHYVVSPKKNTKNHNQHLFWCASHPLISSPLPLPEIASKSEYMQCFCSVNGFMLSSRHQKGLVLALILCLYCAGGGFKPSSIFGVYSKLSDLRAFY